MTRTKIVNKLRERKEGFTQAQVMRALKLSMSQTSLEFKHLESFGVIYCADRHGRYRVAPEY